MERKRYDFKVILIYIRELIKDLNIDVKTTNIILLGDFNYRLNVDHIDVFLILFSHYI